MLTFNGFIQILLILTQSRLAPDLDFVWAPAPAVVEISMEQPELSTATGFQPGLKIETVRIKINRKREPLLFTEKKHRWPVQKNSITGKGRNVVTQNLYLLLCRLNTDG